MAKAKRSIERPKKTQSAKSGRGSNQTDIQVLPHPGHKAIAEIAREQGKELRPWTDEDFERMTTLGKDLFRSHEEVMEFVAGIYERRRQDRGT